MDQKLLYALPSFLVALVLVILGFFLMHEKARAPSVQMPTGMATTSTPLNPTYSIYTNGEYGFVIRYPEGAIVSEDFASYYHLPAAWSAVVLSRATGTPVVSIATYRVRSDTSYPRYFDAEVRIGVSSDPQEVRSCLTLAKDAGEKALPDVTLSGTVLKVFAFQSAGMMQYVRGTSYRALVGGKCLALEKVVTGSSYRDDPKSPKDIPDSILALRAAELDTILSTFALVR